MWHFSKGRAPDMGRDWVNCSRSMDRQGFGMGFGMDFDRGSDRDTCRGS